MTINVLVIGTGEYVTGFVAGEASNSDKSAGVIGLVLFDLKRRGQVDRIILAGRDGKKFPGIRSHFREQIAPRYRDLDISFESFPNNEKYDPQAYKQALKQMEPGSAVIVATPDDTHFEIASIAIQKQMHVLVVKPLVKTVKEHQQLIAMARQNNILLGIEMHKRFDPIYADARDRARTLGDFSYMNSYMSQPRTQLDTFRQWAGRSSDISYYLNSHHIDILDWIAGDRARPILVTALSATGVARKQLNTEVEDTITLTVQWENIPSGNLGISVHTASWIAPKSDVHSQQRFFYMGHLGELQVDQAHRGYTSAISSGKYASLNPLFMKYEPTDGYFSGQGTYGYQSIAKFIDAAILINKERSQPEDFDRFLPTASNGLKTTAILEAGYLSLARGSSPVKIKYGQNQLLTPLELE